METNHPAKFNNEAGNSNNESITRSDNNSKRSDNFKPNPNYNKNKEHQSFQGRPIKRYAANNNNTRRRKPADMQPKLPNTIFNAVTQFNPAVGFSRKDLRRISNIIKTKHSELFGETEPEKIEQIENEQTYQVYCYPETMRRDIKNIVAWYFKVKKERNVKHERVVKLEGLEKLRREGSPDYEMALVRFNMAEEERRKQEKLIQAEQAKKEQLRAKYNKAPNNRGSRPQYNKDRQQNNNRSGQFNRSNNQNRPYKPREFNEERENVPATPPPIDVTININENPVPNVNEVPTPPKPGFLESFLNKIKGKDE